MTACATWAWGRCVACMRASCSAWNSLKRVCMCMESVVVGCQRMTDKSPISDRNSSVLRRWCTFAAACLCYWSLSTVCSPPRWSRLPPKRRWRKQNETATEAGNTVSEISHVTTTMASALWSWAVGRSMVNLCRPANSNCPSEVLLGLQDRLDTRAKEARTERMDFQVFQVRVQSSVPFPRRKGTGTLRIWRARERESIMGVWGLCPQRGPGADPPGQGVKPPWSWKHFNTEEGKFGTLFEVKRLKPWTKYACERETNPDKLTHSKWDYYRLGLLAFVKTSSDNRPI